MQDHSSPLFDRRRLIGAASAAGGLGLIARPAWAETIDLHVKGGATMRDYTTTMPEEGRMIVQRSRPPWLEVFDKGVFTPNDQNFVSRSCRSRASSPWSGLLAGRRWSNTC